MLVWKELLRLKMSLPSPSHHSTYLCLWQRNRSAGTGWAGRPWNEGSMLQNEGHVKK